ncbi:hypothetical protein GCM10012320_01140 [Sinomonas cellulolyticus]|uniref:DUF3043 domain-containing protein n=1 Tax=Sinomonas cellulolyticus TaxID=2801916 RepID=A0ABS1K178_9MICC|nr:MULTISPECIES: DUF3043 domain-containing protein [Sinomonas]MBL0705233.1 DUF3043 domain-containing protein [Sinomonas cellulolyticus]GHG40001.1 hypothetical protein GCM10012320_01140 [Sinomonas sp. KCTC 49339]
MFGRKNEPAAESPGQPAEPDAPLSGKGAPTPRRKDQEAARRRPLVPTDRKASKVAERQAAAEERQRVRRALETGDERHMPFKDRGPQKRFARDFVDSRFNLGEYLMFAALAFVVISFIVPQAAQAQVYILGAFWIVFILVFLDTFWLSRQLKKRLVAKFGDVERGTVWYGSMRALQFRPLRLPKALVKRGQYPS